MITTPFLERKGEGEGKATTLQSFQNWDGPLHPDVKIPEYTLEDRNWLVKFNEQNDFSKLIGFRGWKGFNVNQLQHKRPDHGNYLHSGFNNPSYKSWLQPALLAGKKYDGRIEYCLS